MLNLIANSNFVLSAGQSSGPVSCPAGSEISAVLTSPGGAAEVDYTFSSSSAINNGTAMWVSAGLSITASTVKPVQVSSDCFIRITCLSGSFTVNVNQAGGSTQSPSNPIGSAIVAQPLKKASLNLGVGKNGVFTAPAGIARPGDLGTLTGFAQGTGLWWPMTEGSGITCADQYSGGILTLAGTAGGQWNGKWPGVTLNGTDNALQLLEGGYAGPPTPPAQAAWPYANSRYVCNLSSLAVGEATYIWAIINHATSITSGYLFWSGRNTNGWGLKLGNITSLIMAHRAQGSSSEDDEQFNLVLKSSVGNNTLSAICVMITPNANGQAFEAHLSIKYLGAPARDNSRTICNFARNGIGGTAPASYDTGAQFCWGAATGASEGSINNPLAAGLLNCGVWRRERVAGLPDTIVQNLALNPKNFPAALLA